MTSRDLPTSGHWCTAMCDVQSRR